MSRRLSRRFPVLAGSVPWLLFVSVLYLFAEVVMIQLEGLGGIGLGDARTRIGGGILVISCLIHGSSRVISAHPAFDDGYRGWLMGVPWTNRKRLPFLPVEMVWEDVVVVGWFILLAKTLPVSIAPWLVVAWLTANLVILGWSFFLTRTTGFCYLTALGLGFAVLWIRQPYVSLAILAATYVVAYEGLKRGLDAFPWEPRKLPNLSTNVQITDLSSDVHGLVGSSGHGGWPYERMLGQVIDPRGISRPDAILITLLAMFWLYVLSSLLPNHLDRAVPAAFVFMIVSWAAPLIRLGIYTSGYENPLSPLGRIATFRLVIPRHDVVCLTPLCAGLAGVLVLLAFRRFAPLEIVLPIATAVVVLVTLLGPPSLRRWRLTGGHRLAIGVQKNNRDFVEAG